MNPKQRQIIFQLGGVCRLPLKYLPIGGLLAYLSQSKWHVWGRGTLQFSEASATLEEGPLGTVGLPVHLPKPASPTLSPSHSLST